MAINHIPQRVLPPSKPLRIRPTAKDSSDAAFYQTERPLRLVHGRGGRFAAAAHAEVDDFPSRPGKQPFEPRLGEHPEIGGVVVALATVKKIGERKGADASPRPRQVRGDASADQAEIRVPRKALQKQKRVFQMIEGAQKRGEPEALFGEGKRRVEVHVVDMDGGIERLLEPAGALQAVAVGRPVVDDMDVFHPEGFDEEPKIAVGGADIGEGFAADEPENIAVVPPQY